MIIVFEYSLAVLPIDDYFVGFAPEGETNRYNSLIQRTLSPDWTKLFGYGFKKMGRGVFGSPAPFEPVKERAGLFPRRPAPKHAVKPSFQSSSVHATKHGIIHRGRSAVFYRGIDVI